MKTIITLLGWIVLQQSLWGQFQTCNSSTVQNLYDVCFINPNIGIAVGDSGTIVRSLDGGLNWNLVMQNDTISFKKVKFFDGLNGIAVGSDIFITQDAGLNWSEVPNGNSYYYDVEILNSTTCLISGEPAALIKSTDKGASFSDLVAVSNSNMGLLSFVSETIGYACNMGAGGSSPTLKTTDGGVTWDTIPGWPGVNTVMEAMAFVSDSVGFKGGWYNAHFQKTTDGAGQWADLILPDSLSTTQLLDFHISQDAPNAYYACGWYGKVFKSSDGGDNWITLNAGLPNNISLRGIYFLDDSLGWVVGNQGTILRTTSGGQLVGFPEIEAAPQFRLYPNPATEWLSIVHEGGKTKYQIEIYDLNGRCILSQEQLHRVNLEGLASGMYHVRIKTEKGAFSGKFLKE